MRKEILIFILLIVLSFSTLAGCYKTGKAMGEATKEVEESAEEFEEGYEEGRE